MFSQIENIKIAWLHELYNMDPARMADIKAGDTPGSETGMDDSCVAGSGYYSGSLLPTQGLGCGSPDAMARSEFYCPNQ
jgi:hypothetical protein